MSEGPRAILLAVGNELLNGEIRDRNLYALARRLTRQGFTVERAAMVRDAPQDIAASFCHLLQARPDLLLVSGGLGPTEDDLTLRALARALDRPLVEHAGAHALVEEQYARLIAGGYMSRTGPVEARRKMSLLPQGAHPLPNPIGTAPAVRVTWEGTLIYCLPGVPAELEAIYDASLRRELEERFATGAWAQESLCVGCGDEAELAPVLKEVAHRHVEVYVKSLARPFVGREGDALRIVVAARAEDEAVALQSVAETLTDLRAALQAAGFPIYEPDGG